MKTAGIPIWITYVLLLTVALGVVFGVMALVGAGMDPSQNVSWGGRNLGLGLVAAVAIWLKSPIAYIAAFVGGMGRELGDFISSFQGEAINWPIAILAAFMFVVWVIGIKHANEARFK